MQKWTRAFVRQYARDYRQYYYLENKQEIIRYAKRYQQRNRAAHNADVARYRKKNKLAFSLYQMLLRESRA